MSGSTRIGYSTIRFSITPRKTMTACFIKLSKALGRSISQRKNRTTIWRRLLALQRWTNWCKKRGISLSLGACLSDAMECMIDARGLEILTLNLLLLRSRQLKIRSLNFCQTQAEPTLKKWKPWMRLAPRYFKSQSKRKWRLRVIEFLSNLKLKNSEALTLRRRLIKLKHWKAHH